MDARMQVRRSSLRAKHQKAKDFTNDRVRNRSDKIDEIKRAKNFNKSKIGARVEHVLAVVKRL
jgi:transposase, IS5 family